MKSRIEQEATDEIVRQLSPLVMERTLERMDTRALMSIHRVAGMMEVSPQTVTRLFSSRIIHLGRRQMRIAVADYDEVMASRRGSIPIPEQKKA